MALSAAAVQAAAQTAFYLVGKVLQTLQAVSKAHLDRERDIQAVRALQSKLHDRATILNGFEGQLPADSLPGTFAVIQSNRLMVHRTLGFINVGLQAILDAEESTTAATGCWATVSCFCRAAGSAAFRWDGLAGQVQAWNEQLDQLPKALEGNQAFLEALQRTTCRPQKCTVPGLSGLYLPLQTAVDEALKALKAASVKTLLISGSPGMGKSLLAGDIARSNLPGSRAAMAADNSGRDVVEESPFPDGVLWVDFRNKLDSSGLLLRERLQDILGDLTPPGQEAANLESEDGAKIEQQVAERLAGKRLCIFVDNVHAHDAGTVEALGRISAKHLGKVVLTSCQRQFGPALGVGATVSLTAEAVKKSGVALKLLLAEAGLAQPDSLDHEVALATDPRILVSPVGSTALDSAYLADLLRNSDECARSIISSSNGAGYCLSALALIGSKRRHNPSDLHGWKAAQQSIAAMAQGLPQAPGAFLQGVLEASVRDSIRSLNQPAQDILNVGVLFPTGASLLLPVACEVWSAATSSQAHNFWELLDDLISANLVQMPKPGTMLIPTLHASFLRQLSPGQSISPPEALLAKILSSTSVPGISATLLLLYGGNAARKAAASCFGMSERSNQLWAYNKATAATGGLATLLGSDIPGLSEAAAELLRSMVAQWPSPDFIAAFKGVTDCLLQIWTTTSEMTAEAGKSSLDSSSLARGSAWSMGDSLAALLDAFVAILSQCLEDRQWLPAGVLTCANTLLAHSDPTVKVRAVSLLEMGNNMEQPANSKAGAQQQTLDGSINSMPPSIRFAGEKTFALLREMRTSRDFHQTAAAERLQASIERSRSGF